MQLRDHDKQALRIITTTKSISGRSLLYFDSFLDMYGRWSRSKLIKWKAVDFKVPIERFTFLEPDSVLLLVDSLVANIKQNPNNKAPYIAFTLAYLLSGDEKDKRTELEQQLRKLLKPSRGRYFTAYQKAKEQFQEELRKALLLHITT